MKNVFLIHIQPSLTNLCWQVKAEKTWAWTNELDLQHKQISKFVLLSNVIIIVI